MLLFGENITHVVRTEQNKDIVYFNLLNVNKLLSIIET